MELFAEGIANNPVVVGRCLVSLEKYNNYTKNAISRKLALMIALNNYCLC